MTDHPTPATPEATEREARDDLIRRIDEVGLTRLQPRHVKIAIKVDAYRSADAYAAAVRRAERERLAGIVEGMRVKVDVRDLDDGHESARLDSEFNAALDAILAKLREAK